MNINFGMDNFYVRYLKRFLASEMPQTNMVLGEFDKDDQQLLIQYLNLPNVEPMSKVQKEMLKKFPQLKSLFIMTLKDNYITWTSKSINYEASEYIMNNIEDIKDYCKSVGWDLADAHEWVNDLMDINGDGIVDSKDLDILNDIIYNNNGYEIQKGRISGKLIEPNVIDWNLLNVNVSLYNSYNQLVGNSAIELTNNTYLFKDLEQGTYKVVVSADGYLDAEVNNIYVKTGYISHVQDITMLGGDVNKDGIIDQNDIDEITAHNRETVTTSNSIYDLNKDGIIDLDDLEILNDNKGKVKATLYWVENTEEMDTKNKYSIEIRNKADINRDGIVDKEDVELLTDYLANGRIFFSIKMSNRRNHFPNKDMLVFINQFDGTFLYDYAIRDGGTGVDNFPHKNSTGLFKIALYKCKPNQKITIAHNNYKNTRLVIGSSPARLKQDTTAFMLQNVVEVNLNPGESYQYQASGSETGTYDAQWVCIQCPSSHGDLNGITEKSITGEIGDINFDGKIDMEDYKLAAYYTAEGGASADALHWEATPRQIMAMDVDKDGKVTTKDAVAIYDFINGNYPGISLGLYEYSYNVPSDYSKLDNVSNLLIIDGWYDKEVGIPFLDFAQKEEWIIHGKFFNYLLNMAVHKYSDSDGISFVQEMLKEYYPYTNFGTDFLQVGNYTDVMREMITEYQKTKISYTYGDLDRDGKLTTKDLTILREYLYGLNDFELNTPITLKELRDYLDGVDTNLSYEKLQWADVNQDGVIDEKDYQLLLIYKGDKTLATKVEKYLKKEETLTPDEMELADMNNDGEVTEDDLKKLMEYPRNLDALQRTRADINHNGIIDISCYNVLKANIDGTSDSLTDYLIPFSLGWYDMDTEFYMEQEFNAYEFISEVSK